MPIALLLCVALAFALYGWLQLDTRTGRRLQALRPWPPAQMSAGEPGAPRPWTPWIFSTTAAVAVLLIVAGSAVLDLLAPVTIHLRSTGRVATVTVDGSAHSFVWPVPPQRLAIQPNDPNVHDWGIDGSESLTLNNLDPAYLASLRGNLYIDVDRWLRGEDGYNSWRDVHVAGAGGARGPLRPLPGDVFGAGVALPRSFTFDASISRLERPVDVQFTAPTGTYHLRLDRANRQAVVTDNLAGGPSINLVQWYYPDDPLPPLAVNLLTLTHSLVWALVLFAVASALGALAPRALGTALSAQGRRLCRAGGVVTLLTLGGSLAFTLFIALGEYHGIPHILDGQSYMMQARIFALGRTSIPPPPISDAFSVPFFGVISGHWITQYAPGNALTLVPGALVGLPWLIQPLLGVATLALVWLVGRRLYSIHVATLAVILGALSPFRSFLIGTYLSHPAAAFFIILSYYLLLRGAWGARFWPTLAAGVTLGLAFLCRELSAALAGIPLTLYLLLHITERPDVRSWMRGLAAWLVGGGALLACYALYNDSITGSALVSPRSVLNSSDQYGFGPGHGWWATHTLAAGLVNLDQLLTGLNLGLFGWPYYMTFAVLLIPFLLGRPNRWDVLNGAIAAAVLLGTVGYFYSGVVYGPRYVYEAIPVLLLLAARGIVVLGQAAGALLAALGRDRRAGPLAAHILLLALIVLDLVFFLPRQVQLYNNFTSMAWQPNLNVAGILSQAPHSAIVVTGDWWIYANTLASLTDPHNFVSPTTIDGTVWAIASSPDRYAALSAAYPHRPLYILVTNGANVTYHRWSPAR